MRPKKCAYQNIARRRSSLLVPQDPPMGSTQPTCLAGGRSSWRPGSWIVSRRPTAGRRFSSDTAGSLFKDRGDRPEQGGIEGGLGSRVLGEKLRQCFARGSFARGKNLKAVSRFIGNSSVQTREHALGMLPCRHQAAPKDGATRQGRRRAGRTVDRYCTLES